MHCLVFHDDLSAIDNLLLDILSKCLVKTRVKSISTLILITNSSLLPSHNSTLFLFFSTFIYTKINSPTNHLAQPNIILYRLYENYAVFFDDIFVAMKGLSFVDLSNPRQYPQQHNINQDLLPLTYHSTYNKYTLAPTTPQHRSVQHTILGFLLQQATNYK